MEVDLGRIGAAELTLPSPLTALDDQRLSAAGVQVWLKRDDLIHPELPGNKWRKLKYNLAAAAENGQSTLLTFGGAYSNHIRATAAAGHHFGLATIGVIRGEQHLPLNPVLAFAAARGMRLTYLNRTAYRAKGDPAVIAGLRDEFGDFYLLPEGGSNPPAVRGCAELPVELGINYDLVCCPVGTGGTLAGIAAGLPPSARALGFSALKGGQFLAGQVTQLQEETYGSGSTNWEIEYDFHFGGYAKRTSELDAFIADFERRHQLRLDWVYVAKMMFGIFALAGRGAFDPGTRIVAIITG